MHITYLNALYSEAITALHAQGLRGPALRGALAAHIAINTPNVTRRMSHAIVRFMGV